MSQTEVVATSFVSFFVCAAIATICYTIVRLEELRRNRR